MPPVACIRLYFMHFSMHGRKLIDWLYNQAADEKERDLLTRYLEQFATFDIDTTFPEDSASFN